MHRTEGTNNAGNMFTDGPPGTVVEENWLNAVQEEICYFITQSGGAVQTAATETRTQLWTAFTTGVATLTNKRLNNPAINSAATTGITSAELEQLSDGSNADSLHIHSAAALPSGMPIQVRVAVLSTYVGCDASIPLDTTKPQITEGTEVLTLSFTPLRADSLLLIEAFVWGIMDTSNTDNELQAAIFVGATADAIGATAANGYGGASQPHQISVAALVASSGSTTARTYRLRVGQTQAAGFRVNATAAGAALYDGVAVTYLKVTEIKA